MSRHRPAYATPEDVRLLRVLAEAGSVAAAARSAGLSRDRAVYRLERLERLLGGSVVESVRGGRAHGGSRLTTRGWGLLRRGLEVVRAPSGPSPSPDRSPSTLRGTYRVEPDPHVEFPGGLSLSVSFRAEDGGIVRVAVDPESVLLARRSFPSSARNVIESRVGRLRRLPNGLLRVECRPSGTPIASLVTRRAARSLGLAPRIRVVLFIKATSIRRV